MICRLATADDLPAMARIRAAEWESEEYWLRRITGYFEGTLHPQNALKPRVTYIAEEGDQVAGFIAGHLTERFACNGELQWINVVPAHRGTGVAVELLRLLARWFVEQKAPRVCVDPDEPARRFYLRYGAVPLNQHWLVWEDMGTVLQTVRQDPPVAS